VKATLVLQNGTKVELDGDASEVQGLLGYFSGAGSPSHDRAKQPTSSVGIAHEARDNDHELSETVTELVVVNRIKEDESLEWAHAIIDSRDVTRRVLLPLYVAAEINPRADGLTSGFITRVYSELGVRLDQANVSKELSGRAKKYVLADGVRRKGAPVHYKISRAGRIYLENGRDG
jgi:hypothetical protein